MKSFRVLFFENSLFQTRSRGWGGGGGRTGEGGLLLLRSSAITICDALMTFIDVKLFNGFLFLFPFLSTILYKRTFICGTFTKICGIMNALAGSLREGWENLNENKTFLAFLIHHVNCLAVSFKLCARVLQMTSKQ